jgi:hypothetical protein
MAHFTTFVKWAISWCLGRASHNVKTATPSRRSRPNLEPLERRELLDGGALAAAYGQIPLSFEANQGQTDPPRCS